MTVYLSEVEVLVELVDGLKKAAGASHALAHYQQKPQWLKIRDNLEVMIVACQELASAKSIPRYQLEPMLDKLKTKVDKKLNTEVGN